MRLRVLIVPDKFKGTLSAAQAAEAIAEGWREARPGDLVDLLPMSDGGDGFGEVLSSHLRAQPQPIETVDAAHRPLEARWWWDPGSRTAIVESAQVIGLALLPVGKYHPFKLDTRGLAAVLEAARKKGALRCLVGIGGSATNDAGFGLARALGWQFLDEKGGGIESWLRLDALDSIRPPKRRRWFRDLRVAVDVRNRLLGLQGATRVYGPQKGLEARDFTTAERCLRRLVFVARRQGLPGVATAPGAGAAGGLGYGLGCFLGARLMPGFALFAKYSRLPKRLQQVDLVLTGEGAIDESTRMGKGVGEIARLCRAQRVPCIGLAGRTPWDNGLSRGPFTRVTRIVPELASREESQRRPAYWLAALAAQTGKLVTNNGPLASVLSRLRG
jgi:glycerate kinase